MIHLLNITILVLGYLFIRYILFNDKYQTSGILGLFEGVVMYIFQIAWTFSWLIIFYIFDLKIL